MQAVVYHAPGDIRVEERPEPASAAGNLIVRVRVCAICGTDLKLATVGNPRCHPPRIIGHEMVGEIVHAGADVHGFAPGERITLATTVACGNCPYCDRGLGNMCPNAKPISYDFDGAFAPLVAIPPMALAGGNVIRVPDAVPDDAATLSEPLSCALNAQELVSVKAGDNIDPQPVESMPEELWDQVIGINLTGPFLLAKYCIPGMKTLGGGRIINVTSISARTGGGPGSAHYVASKAGLEGFTRSLAKELAPFNITVNGVAPGLVYTPIHERINTPESLERLRQTIPLLRISRADEVARVVTFLASEDASFMTGEIVAVNGGMRMN